MSVYEEPGEYWRNELEHLKRHPDDILGFEVAGIRERNRIFTLAPVLLAYLNVRNVSLELHGTLAERGAQKAAVADMLADEASQRWTPGVLEVALLTDRDDWLYMTTFLRLPDDASMNDVRTAVAERERLMSMVETAALGGIATVRQFRARMS